MTALAIDRGLTELDSWAADPVGFDLNSTDPRFIDNPFPTYARLRRESPVHRNPDGTYFVTRHSDVIRVFRGKEMSNIKDELFLTKFGPTPIYEHFVNLMVFKDPPEHSRIRKVVARAFTPAALAGYEPRVEQAIDDLFEKASAKGRMDLIGDFGYVLPMTVIAVMLGVPPSDRDLFVRWSAGVSQSLEPYSPPDLVNHASKLVDEFKAYLGNLANERRRKPGDDLMTMLVEAEQDGERISELELVHNASFLLAAGHETTSSLIGSGTIALMRFPDQMELLRSRPELAEQAVEELLRYDSPNQIGGRMPTVDVDFSGIPIPAGTFIWVSNGAANRDPDQFADPERVDITRTPNPHLAFGYGIHSCLGAALARLEGRCAFRRLVSVFPTLRLDGEPVRRPRTRHRGYVSIPVAF